MNQIIHTSLTSIRLLVPLILIIAAIAVFLKHLQQGNSSTTQTRQSDPTTLITVILLLIYLMIYASLTFGNREIKPEAQINLTPFWSYSASFQFNPPTIKDPELARQILLNVLLTIPAGLLLPLLYHNTRHPLRLTILTVLLVSIATEALQYVTHLGLCETDDVIHNLAGGLIGAFTLKTGDKLNNAMHEQQDKRKNNSEKTM